MSNKYHSQCTAAYVYIICTKIIKELKCKACSQCLWKLGVECWAGQRSGRVTRCAMLCFGPADPSGPGEDDQFGEDLLPPGETAGHPEPLPLPQV